MTDIAPYNFPVEPVDITKLQWSSGSTDYAIASAFRSSLRNTLAEAVVEPDFDPGAVKDAFLQTVEDCATDVVWQVIDEESSSRYEDYQPVICKIGELVDEGVLVGNEPIVVDPAFSADLARQMSELPDDRFSSLKQYHDVLASNRSLELATETTHLYQERQEGWLDEAYGLVGQAMHNPDYTPDINHPEALYLIPFLPHAARQLTRRALVGNHMSARVEAELGEMNEAEVAMLAALKRYVASDALEGQHWRDYGKWYGMGETTSAEIAIQSAIGLDALADMQDLLKQGDGTRVAEAWNRVSEELKGAIEEVSSYPNPLDRWQLIDNGHCFEGFRDQHLRKVISADAYIANGAGGLLRDFHPEKSGDKVVILEDDDKQMAQWRETFDAHSVYEVADATSHTTLEGLDVHYTDPDATLFLLDVQNGEDSMAGIRAADALIRARIAMIRDSQDPSTLKRTEVIVWSASPEAEALANEQLRSVLESEGIEIGSSNIVGYDGGGMGSHFAGHRLAIDVRSKYVNVSDLGRNS